MMWEGLPSHGCRQGSAIEQSWMLKKRHARRHSLAWGCDVTKIVMSTISGLPGQGAPDPIVRRVDGGIAQNAGRPASLTNGKDPPFRAIPVGEIGLSRTRRNLQRAFDWLGPAAFLAPNSNAISILWLALV